MSWWWKINISHRRWKKLICQRMKDFLSEIWFSQRESDWVPAEKGWWTFNPRLTVGKKNKKQTCAFLPPDWNKWDDKQTLLNESWMLAETCGVKGQVWNRSGTVMRRAEVSLWHPLTVSEGGTLGLWSELYEFLLIKMTVLWAHTWQFLC